MPLSRKQRIAASCIGFLMVTIVALMFAHYGQGRSGLLFEMGSALIYAIWIYLGKAED